MCGTGVRRLPLGCSSKHASGFPTLRIDLDHTGDIKLQPLNHGGPVGLIFNYHGADRGMKVSLSSDLSFRCCASRCLFTTLRTYRLRPLTPMTTIVLALLDNHVGYLVESCVVLFPLVAPVL